MSFRDVLLAVLPPLLWAVTYTTAKSGLAHFPPLLFMGIVYAIAALMLWRPGEQVKTSRLSLICIAAFGGAIQSGFVFAALAGMPASLASLAVQLQVPFAVLAAAMICGERLSPLRCLGILIAFAGVALASGAVGSGSVRMHPLLLMVAGTMSWGVAQALIRRFGRDQGRIVIASIARYAAPMLLAMSAILEHGQLAAISSAGAMHWLSAVVLASGGFALAYSIWYALLGRHRVDRVAPFALLMPPFGLLSGWLFLSEAIGAAEIVGACVIVAGLWIIVRSPRIAQIPTASS
ncbi:MAG: EamA family transporter [Rhodospirillaceae bacterium]|nr:EamA family transporter [Rhodospirillaceae bacterium]